LKAKRIHSWNQILWGCTEQIVLLRIYAVRNSTQLAMPTRFHSPLWIPVPVDAPGATRLQLEKLKKMNEHYSTLAVSMLGDDKSAADQTPRMGELVQDATLDGDGKRM